VLPDFPAIVLLSVMVVEMAFSHTLISGIEFGGLFLLNTALVFTVHFLILPTRPKVRLGIQLDIILKNLETYFETITADYPNLESGIAATQQAADKARKSVSEYKRLWQLLGISSPDLIHNKNRFNEVAKGLEGLLEYLLLVWQFRARAWESVKFKDYILQNAEFKSIISQMMGYYHPDLQESSVIAKKHFQEKLQIINSRYLLIYQNDKSSAAREEWVAIFNAVHSLLAFTESMDATADIIEVPHESSIREKINSFLTGIKTASGKLKFSNPAFRFGLRSAIIVGSVMAYYRFFGPVHGFWLVLFSILLIRPNLGVSIKAGRDRLLGTLVGCLAGFAFVSFVPAGSIVFYSSVLLSVFFMIWFTNLNKFILMIAALTFLIISLFSLIYPSQGGIAWLRLGYTAGIVVFVIFISFLLWPEKARKKFAHALADTLEVELQYFLSIIRSLLNGGAAPDSEKQKNQLTQQIAALEEIIDATKNEILQAKTIHHGIIVQRYILRLRNTLHSMDFAAKGCMHQQEFPGLAGEINNFADHCKKAFDSLINAFRKFERANGFPDLRDDFLKVRDSFRAIRGKPDPGKEEITQQWNISTFIWNLKPLILELEGIKAEIDLKMDES
jgi:hypothetical protein